MDVQPPSPAPEAGPDDAQVAEANRLYWGSGAGVNEIAARLDLSKSALYGMLRPLAAGRSCPACDGALEYPHRTARDNDIPRCAACGHDEAADGPGITAPPVGRVVAPAARREPPVPREPRVTATEATPSGARLRTIVGGALLGAAAGLVLFAWTRRRR